MGWGQHQCGDHLISGYADDFFAWAVSYSCDVLRQSGLRSVHKDITIDLLLQKNYRRHKPVPATNTSLVNRKKCLGSESWLHRKFGV